MIRFTILLLVAIALFGCVGPMTTEEIRNNLALDVAQPLKPLKEGATFDLKSLKSKSVYVYSLYGDLSKSFREKLLAKGYLLSDKQETADYVLIVPFKMEMGESNKGKSGFDAGLVAGSGSVIGAGKSGTAGGMGVGTAAAATGGAIGLASGYFSGYPMQITSGIFLYDAKEFTVHGKDTPALFKSSSVTTGKISARLAGNKEASAESRKLIYEKIAADLAQNF